MTQPASQLVIQRDGSLLVTPGYGRDRLAALVRRCAELRSVVAGNYLYRVSPIALWGSAARGLTAEQILSELDAHSTTPLPEPLVARISESIGRYGAISMTAEGAMVKVQARDPAVLEEIDAGIEPGPDGIVAPLREAGRIKIAAARAGWPIVDSVRTPSRTLDARLNAEVCLRPYQADAVESFSRSGNGVVLLPCGSGKTVVGIAALCATSAATLILTPSRSVAEQWRTSLLAMTSLTAGDVTLASSGAQPTPVTIATYHGATIGQVAGSLLDYPWGLVIYDEVQSLPADMFRLSAALQSSRRLGLTATLVREDGREREVFALVGPPVFDMPWVDLERQGWIAPARCVEVRVPAAPTPQRAMTYKLAVVERLLHRHRDSQVLLVGSNLDSLRRAARVFDIPVLTGKSSAATRTRYLDAFKAGEIRCLALSRIGSVGIDLPGAEALIQISGTYGSRQEEAQRLGRLLRPAPGKIARFYTLVSEGTPEVRYAEKRQRFLVEQGYTYELLPASDLPRPASG